MRRRAIVAALVGLAGVAPAANAQPVDWLTGLAESLAAFDALHEAVTVDPSLRETEAWQLALLDAVFGVLIAAQQSGDPALLQLARDFAGDYTEGIGLADEALIAQALDIRGVFRTALGV